jgi:hypothetical protein
VPAGVSEDQLIEDANTACRALVGIIAVMLGIQVMVKGNLRDFWTLYFIL